MRPRSRFRILVLSGGLLGSAITQANSTGQVTTSTVLTEASAAAFVQECVEAWSKRDDAMWDQIVDFALFPKGALPIMLRDGKEPDVDLWVTSFSELAQWLKVNPVGDVAKSMQVVANIEDQELRDLRALSVEELRAGSSDAAKIRTISTQTLTLGLDFNGDGTIGSQEKTRVHLADGTLYWEPFGW